MKMQEQENETAPLERMSPYCDSMIFVVDYQFGLYKIKMIFCLKRTMFKHFLIKWRKV